MENLRAEITHSEKTYKTLCRIRYNLFHKDHELKLDLAGAGVILLSLFIHQTTLSLLILFIGCWLIVSAQTPPMRMAKLMIDQAKGSFPITTYTFTPHNIEASNQYGNSSAAYTQIQHLVKSPDYYYLFLQNETGYMIDARKLSCDKQEFLAFLEKKLGIEAIDISELSSWNFILTHICQKNTKVEPPHL